MTTAAASSSYGERRQLTIVFSDIVGSTELSAQLDPEDWHKIVTRYYEAATALVKKFEGYIAQFLGDGILILFGYPQAHESDAERAIRAGLELITQIQILNKSFQREFGKSIQIRVGIHTGEVMIPSEGIQSGKIFGDAPNIAARVQSATQPDTVCISSATQHLVAGFFIVEDLGPHILKGVPEAVQLYRVDRASGVRSRLHASTRSSLTPFMGREDERNLLTSRWQLAQKGKGQLVMITGEAGIGKSRLLQQFKEDLGGVPHTWVEGESSQYEQDTPFAPTIDLVNNIFQWTSETTPEKKINDLEQSFEDVGLDTQKSIPLMASLLGFPIPGGKYPPLLLSPDQLRAELIQTLIGWVIASSILQPMVLVVEDLHFSDPSTLQEFVMLGELIEDNPLMLVFTSRPQFKPPWPTRSFHTLINLNRLDPDNVRQIIERLLGKRVPHEALASLVTRADGNPLFAEELSQSLSDSRKMTAAAQQIPSTLQDLLMARLDSLGPIKEVAQIGSVLGRAFPHSLLAAIANQAEDKLDAALLELIDSGLVFVESIQKDTIYTFKHALVQEAAYGLLLKSRRRELHLAAATALKEKFPDLAHQRPELVAHHLTEAGDTENAVEAWQNAGDYAIGRAAYAEAERHFSKALQVLKFMPESSERDHLELPLQLSIANAYKVTTGFGSDAQLIAYARAREISEQLGDSAQFLFILLGLWGASNSRSDLVTSRELSSELTRLAERDQNTMMMTWAYQTQAAEAFEQGNFADTLKQFERMCQYYKTEEQAWSPFDPKLVAYIHAALATYHAGFADKARTLIHGQYELAKDMYPGNVAMAYLGACSLYLIIHEPELILENALPMIEIADKEDIPSYHGWGTIYRGAAYVYQGKFTEGISVLTEGISAYLATGTHSSLAQYLSVLAEGYAGAGEIEKALSIVEDAFGATGEELMHLPYLHRLRGEFLQLRGSDEDIQKAEEQYRMAIDYCQKFGSLTLELRAATRQAQLLQSKSKIVEAHALLAPLYAKFTEGFDTLYLRDAKTLLDELEIKNGEKFG